MNKTPKEVLDKILPLYNEGKLGQDIAKEIGVSDEVVTYYLRKNGYPSHKYKNKNAIKKVEKEILELHSEGKNSVEIGNTLNVNAQAVNKYLKDNGLTSNYSKKRRLEVKNDEGLCRRCFEWKELSKNFQKGRVGTSTEYWYSYCNDCRNVKTKTRLKTNFSSYLNSVAGRIRRRNSNLPFDLTTTFIKELWDKQNGKCFYSDYELIFGQRVGLCPNSMSIDKIIPELGYTQGNVVLCSTRINSMKSNATVEEMKKWMPDWYQRLVDAEFVITV